MVAQTPALNSSVHSGEVVWGARKKFDRDLRREDWNLFGKKIKKKDQPHKRIWTSSVGPGWREYYLRWKICANVCWVEEGKKNRSQRYGRGKTGFRKIIEGGVKPEKWRGNTNVLFPLSNSQDYSGAQDFTWTPNASMKLSVKEEGSNLLLPSDEQLMQMVEM